MKFYRGETQSTISDLCFSPERFPFTLLVLLCSSGSSSSCQSVSFPIFDPGDTMHKVAMIFSRSCLRDSDAPDGRWHSGASLLYMYLLFLTYLSVTVSVAGAPAQRCTSPYSIPRTNSGEPWQISAGEVRACLSEERCHECQPLVHCSMSENAAYNSSEQKFFWIERGTTD